VEELEEAGWGDLLLNTEYADHDNTSLMADSLIERSNTSEDVLSQKGCVAMESQLLLLANFQPPRKCCKEGCQEHVNSQCHNRGTALIITWVQLFRHHSECARRA